MTHAGTCDFANRANSVKKDAALAEHVQIGL